MIRHNAETRLRVLICAHDFAPNLSPQSLRITRLCEQLLRLGHDVRVVTRSTRSGMPEQVVIDESRIVRASPGWALGMTDGLSSLIRRGRSRQAVTGVISATGLGQGLKAGLIKAWFKLLGSVYFPDARSGWVRPAVHQGRALLRTFKPDVVVASHEPAASLRVGLELVRTGGIPLVAELGDPVLTPYTPRRWQQAALALESKVCRKAAVVVVTSSATAALLRQRHGSRTAPLVTIPQGFSPPAVGRVPMVADAACLQLVYTGRFYAFRDPAPLVEAVLRVPGCRLTVAGPELPDSVARLFLEHPDKLTFAGNLPQDEAVSLQRSSDLLVNIGNAGMSQIPGKLMEYLGSGRPVLHLQPDADDPAAAFVAEEQCGYVVPLDTTAITVRLSDLVERNRHRRLEDGLRLGPLVFRKYSWEILGQDFEAACQRAAQGEVGQTSPLSATSTRG